MEKKKPVKKFFLGDVTAAIWENESQGGTFHSVTLTRRYKEGETFRDSSSFGLFDLPKLIQVAARALAWISFQDRDEKPEEEAV